jgi:lipopolysaccharide/colanic/teichoic acid biosynthesis glycosyltransferase
MSLVGPRPALPEEVAAYPAEALERLAVLPGITGAWQVAGRADLSFEQMVALDVGYVRTATLMTDLHLLAQTVRAVASGRGAY